MTMGWSRVDVGGRYAHVPMDRPPTNPPIHQPPNITLSQTHHLQPLRTAHLLGLAEVVGVVLQQRLQVPQRLPVLMFVWLVWFVLVCCCVWYWFVIGGSGGMVHWVSQCLPVLMFVLAWFVLVC